MPFLCCVLVFAIIFLYFNAWLILLMQFNSIQESWPPASEDMMKREKEAKRSLGFLFALFPVPAAGAWRSITKRHSGLPQRISSYSPLQLPNLLSLWELQGKVNFRNLF